ncbi:unnamed protein product, partial [Symbiodinium pilosum]
MGARSATGQAINRAFARSSKAKEIYKWLGEDLKRKFRMSWSLHRNFDTDVFVEFNEWTQTENFLLVEKLSSSTQAEEWAEVVEQCDGSATFATESFRMKARRKYAVVNGLKFEDVTVEEVEKSPQGLKGWGEMVVTVPGIEEASKGAPPVAQPTWRKRKADSSPIRCGNDVDPSEAIELKETEKTGKNIVVYLPMLTLFVDRTEAIAHQMIALASKIDVMSKDEESHDGISSARQGAGEKLRQLLLDRFVMGLLPGSDVAELCHWITKAGGVGVQDLALKPELAKRHGSEHVTLHAGKVFPDRDLTYIDVPLYQKREARRTSEKIPIMLPSKLLEKFVFKDEVYKKDDVNLAKYLQGLPCYEQHPVVRRARANRESEIVRPLALYWDG